MVSEKRGESHQLPELRSSRLAARKSPPNVFTREAARFSFTTFSFGVKNVFEFRARLPHDHEFSANLEIDFSLERKFISCQESTANKYTQ